MEFLVQLLFCCLWAAICCRMAENRGRDKVIGAVLGALFGIFAVIGYWIAGDKTPPTAPTI